MEVSPSPAFGEHFGDSRVPDSDDEPEPEAEIDLDPPSSTAAEVAVADSGWGASEDLLITDSPLMQRPSVAGTASQGSFAAAPAPGNFASFDDSPYAIRSVEEGAKTYANTMRSPNTDDVDDDDNSANESDNLIAAALRPEPDERAHVTTAAMAASRQALMNLVLWRNPVLTGGVFAVLNVFSLLIVYARFTVIGLCANVILLSIFLHVCYRLASIAYSRATNKQLDAYAAIKQHVGGNAVAFTSVEETMAEVANTPLRVDFLTPLAGALEGGLNVCLCEVKDAILLKSFGTCVKVTACAWFVAFFCASFEASKVVYALIIALFTLPKLWSMRSPAVDDMVRIVGVRTHAMWTQFHENVLSKLPSSSVLKEM